MGTTLDITQVTTGDAHPHDPPHRISAQPTKDTATVDFTIETDGPDVRSYRFFEDGVDHNSGSLVSYRGVIVGPVHKCGPGLRCSDWRAAEPAALSEDITYAEIGGPDRTADIEGYAMAEGGAWSG